MGCAALAIVHRLRLRSTSLLGVLLVLLILLGGQLQSKELLLLLHTVWLSLVSLGL